MVTQYNFNSFLYIQWCITVGDQLITYYQCTYTYQRAYSPPSTDSLTSMSPWITWYHLRPHLYGKSYEIITFITSKAAWWYFSIYLRAYRARFRPFITFNIPKSDPDLLVYKYTGSLALIGWSRFHLFVDPQGIFLLSGPAPNLMRALHGIIRSLRAKSRGGWHHRGRFARVRNLQSVFSSLL